VDTSQGAHSAECVERLYEKSSNSGEPPRHETVHGSVHERFPPRTQPLVVFAHPPLLVDPRNSSFYHPPAREHQEAFGGISFCQSAFTPSLAHSLAHLISTSSGAGFFGCSTTSTLQSPGSSSPSLCPCPLRASPRPTTAEKGEETARPLCAPTA
jgi:hypothetical protein